MSDATKEFTEFVAARQQALGRMAFLLTGEHHAAEDLVQTALAKTYLAWEKIQAGDAVEAYVRRIIVNEHTSWWRRAWRRREHVTDQPPEPGAAAGTTAGVDPTSAAGDRQDIWRAIRTLPPRQRAVIVLRYYEDLTEVDTARTLGVSVGTVKSQTNRAFAKLRDRLSSPHSTSLVTKEEVTS